MDSFAKEKLPGTSKLDDPDFVITVPAVHSIGDQGAPHDEVEPDNRAAQGVSDEEGFEEEVFEENLEDGT